MAPVPDDVVKAAAVDTDALAMPPPPTPSPLPFSPDSPLSSLPPPSSPPSLPLREEPVGKRRKLIICMSSPTKTPPSPSLGSRTEPKNTDWWTLERDSDSPVHFAVMELQRYHGEWEQREKDPFWHRKSRKAVISVVVCRDRDTGVLAAFRGMNTEVSLPAGSLCAERTAIANAASSCYFASDVLAIATLDPSDKANPLWPCEVCQSWLAKLREQSPEIHIIAVRSLKCEQFLVRVNGEPLPPHPPLPMPSPVADSKWPELVVLAEGSTENPWEAEKTVYVDGSWAYLHIAQQNILKEAVARGSHLLVGIHSDETVLEVFGEASRDPFETRMGRILHNRFVSSVLQDAPWVLTQELLDALNIKCVVTGSVNKASDGGNAQAAEDPYRVARELGILEVVQSLNGTTERSVMQQARL